MQEDITLTTGLTREGVTVHRLGSEALDVVGEGLETALETDAIEEVWGTDTDGTEEVGETTDVSGAALAE